MCACTEIAALEQKDGDHKAAAAAWEKAATLYETDNSKAYVFVLAVSIMAAATVLLVQIGDPVLEASCS